MTINSTTDDLIAEIRAEMKNAEQAAFEDWLEQKCPSGDADSVHAQWKDSPEYSDLWGDYPYVSELLARIRELEEAQRVLVSGIEAVAALMDESSGVAGLHLNGDLAEWHSLRTGGEFEEWLLAFDEAQAVSP